MRKQSLVAAALLAAPLIVNSPVYAEASNDCELNVNRETSIAAGGGMGGILATLAAPGVCAVFLSAAPADLGISATVCVAVVGLAGTVAGTAVAENGVHQQLRRCVAKSSE
jgi:hypothetical protein